MYSSSVSNSSTIPVDSNWARSISTEDISLHPSEYYATNAEFNDDFLKRLTRPITLPQKESKKDNVDDLVAHKCVDEYIKREIGKECEGWDSIRSRLRTEAEDRKELPKKFLLSKQPWYIPPKKTTTELDPLKKYYCFPKICVELGNYFVHYKKIIEFMKNGIYIFLIDLKYGTEKTKLKALRHIEKARKYCDSISSVGSTIAIGFQLGSRSLKTGLVKNNREVFIDPESKVILTANRKYSDRCTHRVIYVNFKNYRQRFSHGDLIVIGGSIKLQVLKRLREGVYCRVIQEGLLTSAMPVQIPLELTLEPIDVTAEEEEDVAFAIKQKATFIVCPCVYKPKVIHYMRWMMASHEWEVNTFAKISVTNDFLLKDIDIFLSDYTGIWMHGYPFKNNKLFDYIVDKCMVLNRLFVRSASFPSEDINLEEYVSVKKMFLYADCISIPVAGNISPLKMKHFIRKRYPEMNEDTLSYSCKYFLQTRRSIEQIFFRYAFYSSVLEQVTCIIILNNSGKTVAALSRSRPLAPIVANLCDIAVMQSLMLLKNVYPIVHFATCNMIWADELGVRFENSLSFAKSMGFIKPDEPFMVCYDSFRGGRYSDAYRILYTQ